MDKWIKGKIGDFVEDKVKEALGIEDKDEDEDDKEGGFFSKIFDRDGDEEKLKKMREKQKHKDEDEDDKEGGFFSKIFNRDEKENDKDDDNNCSIFNRDDEGKEKKSGFSGLFSELEGAHDSGGYEGGDIGGGEEGGGVKGHTVAVNDGDLFNDLMDVAEETSKGK